MAKIQCSTCGGMAEVGESLHGECPYCGCAVAINRISSFNNVDKTDFSKIKISLEQEKAPTENNNLALALCYLKAGNYTLAKKKLETVMEESPECAEGYYYFAIALLHNRDLSELTLREAKQTAEYLQTAISLDDKFPFPKLFYALLCLEYYEANELNPPADGTTMLNELSDMELDAGEFDFLKKSIHTNII